MEHGTYTFPPQGWDAAGSEATPPVVPWEPPEGKTTAEWCLEPDAELVEILGPLVTEGARVVIGGDSGHGKTTLVMQMVHAIATGGECLGLTGCGAPVMILDLEQGRRTMKRRFREAGLDTVDDVMVYRSPDGMDLLSPQQLAWTAATVEAGLQHTPYAAVVIDPLYKAHHGDSNDERAMVDLMRSLDGLRERYGFSLIIPMHLRKMSAIQKEPTMSDIFGSGGVVRGAEIVVGIQRLEPEAAHAAKLHLWKDRDGDLHDTSHNGYWNLDFDRELGGFRRVADDAVVRVPSPQKIMRYLTECREPVTKRQIISAVGIADKTAESALKALLDAEQIQLAGWLGEHGAKLYQLPPNAIILQQDGGVQSW